MDEPFRYLSNQIERFLHTLVRDLFARLQLRVVGIAVEAQDIVRVFGADGDELTGSGPDDLQDLSSVHCREHTMRRTFLASTSILRTTSPLSQSQKTTTPDPRAPKSVPPYKPSRAHEPAPFIGAVVLSRKFLNIRTFVRPSSTAYVFESPAQANELPFPNALFLHARAVYTMYSPSPTTVTKRPFGECVIDVEKISVVPISLIASGIRLPSAMVTSWMVCRLPERTALVRV